MAHGTLNGPSAWLVIVAGDERQHAGNDGYDDSPDSHYSWDSTVPKAADVGVGDVLVFWDKKRLLGASVIEEIEQWDKQKPRYSCPECGKASFKERKTKTPRYLCFMCDEEFDQPNSRMDDVVAYRSSHGAGWAELAGVLDGSALRALCDKPKSQHSIRELDWQGFKSSLAAAGVPEKRLVHLEARVRSAEGHSVATVRVRRGQGAFRRDLLDTYGSHCAISGLQPVEVLEAAHLYSYASVGAHHAHGGLLLRRDFHTLFDLGMLAVDPESERIDLVDELREYPGYGGLHGSELRVSLTPKAKSWLKLHWDQHR